MRTVGTALLLGLTLAGVAWVGGAPHPAARRPMCDSPEVEETAFAALDYINSLQRHGYKYALERIEDAKVIPAPTGGEVYLLELDLMQTTCHVLDPTPLANCTVRDKMKMTIEGDCDVAVSKVNGVLAVKAFKCKSKPESREEMCLGCPVLLPLNHTEGLQMVDRSVAIINKQSNITTMRLLEVARLTSQVVGGGPKMDAEFVLVETDCTDSAAGGCVPLQGPKAHLAVCVASSVGQPSTITVNCKLFPAPAAPVAPTMNDTVGVVPPPPPVPPAPLPGNMHHKLIHLHLSDPSATGLLSEESVEVPAVVKREAPAPNGAPEGPPGLGMAPGIQLGPGRRRLP